MDKTSENGWMESIVPPFSPPDIEVANSAIAGAARNCCPVLAFNFQGRTVSIFILCIVIESEFFIHLGSWNRRLPFADLIFPAVFIFENIVKLPFHKG